MKQLRNPFLRAVVRLVKSFLSSAAGAVRRRAVILAACIAVVTVVTCKTGEFYGSTGEAMAAFAEMPEQSNESETELEQTKEETEAATEKKKWQVGPGYETRAELQTKPPQEETTEAEPEEEETEAVPVIAYTDQDYRILQRIVQAEAGDSDVKGRILVANVVMNRVRADEFPDTITAVVYERNQFSPVNNGSINTCKVTQETIEAVDRALAGEDYSQGALYFMNRRRASKKNVRWFDRHLTYLFEYGGHEFFK